MRKILALPILAAALGIGPFAVAAENGRSSDSNTAAQVAQATGAAGEKSDHKVTGPATGTNVKPSTGTESAGNPGQPGMRGNKSGPPAKPSKDSEKK